MRNIRHLALALFAIVSVCLALAPVRLAAQAYAGRPKLIVVVVIDQFRGDYLNRDRAKFTGRGFRLFMDQGAWFTDCYYDYANTKTAPGHATIGTGAYTDGHGIEANEFWDAARSWEHKVTSVEDERYQLVDLPAASIAANQPGAYAKALPYAVGASPRNLRATTFGDEIRLATQGRARLFGVSLKDRAAILPAGQTANAAYWIDHRTGRFTTSTYYMEHLPEWARTFNENGSAQQAAHKAQARDANEFYDQVGQTPAANSYELDFAKALIVGEKLGQNGVTDVLTISLSANDIEGHKFGPDSLEQEQMILALDRDLDGFFAWLDRTVGLGDVWLALTADHGIAPIPAEAAKLGLHSASINSAKLYADLNAALNERFSPGQKIAYLLPGPDLPHIVLDRRAFELLKIDRRTAEEAAAALLPAAVAKQNPAPAANAPALNRLPPTLQVAGVYTSQQLARGELPATELARLWAHSYADHGEWAVALILEGYQQPAYGGGTTHFAPWSYDRHVPLAFYGAPFRPGEYHERVAPVDLAATFASLAGVNQPSAAVGRVLTEALKPVSAR